MEVEYADFEHRQKQLTESASMGGRAPAWAVLHQQRTGILADDLVAAAAEGPEALRRLMFLDDSQEYRTAGTSFSHPTTRYAQRWSESYAKRTNIFGMTGEEARAKVRELDRPASSDPRARQAWLAAKQRPASSDPRARSAWLDTVK